MVLIHCIKFYFTVLDKTNTNKNLQYINGFDIWKEDICNLENIILRNEDGIDEKIIDIRSDKEKKGENDKIKILNASF